MDYQKSIYNPRKEAEKFLKTSKFIFEYQAVFEYRDGFYQEVKDRELMDRIGIQLNNSRDQSRINKIREVMETAKNYLANNQKVTLNTDPHLINVRNGILDIRLMRLVSHSPNPVFLYQVHANYNPSAKCPTWRKFLTDVFSQDEELIKLIHQFFGYCFYMTSPLPFDRALILYGGGSNGKNVLLSPLEKMLDGFISTIQFEQIGRDRFASADLAGKLINISSELEAKYALKDREVKKIISGDKIRVQRKFEHAFDLWPIAKHFICTNNLPITQDRTFGFFRRFFVIPFNLTFLFDNEESLIEEFISQGKPFELIDPFIENRLANELDGIFLESVRGLKSLLDDKKFFIPKVVEEMNQTFRLRSSTVQKFAKLHLDCNRPTSRILLSDAYQEYVSFVKEKNLPAETLKEFSKVLREEGFSIRVSSGNLSFIVGASLK